MRFRATAPPTREATASPNLCPGRSRRYTKTLTPRPETFSPPRMTSRNSFVARIRSALEKRWLTYITASRFLPLARRGAPGPPRAAQDSLAPLGPHPLAKSVGAFSLNAAGLIGALHSSRPSPSNVTLLKRLIVVLCDSLVNFNPRRPGTGQKVVVIVGLACYKNRAKLYPGSCHQARVLVQHPFLRWNPTS